MPSHIVAYPSVTSSLHNLQYATNINNVPLHAGPNGRSAESEELLKRSMSHSGGGPNKMPVLAALPNTSSRGSHNNDMLTMRSNSSRKIHT